MRAASGIFEGRVLALFVIIAIAEEIVVSLMTTQTRNSGEELALHVPWAVVPIILIHFHLNLLKIFKH